MKQRRLRSFRKLTRQRNSVFSRFPLMFTLLGTFGVTATYYGFTHLMDKFPIMARDPFIALGVGLFVLLLTGTLYKRLG